MAVPLRWFVINSIRTQPSLSEYSASSCCYTDTHRYMHAHMHVYIHRPESDQQILHYFSIQWRLSDLVLSKQRIQLCIEQYHVNSHTITEHTTKKASLGHQGKTAHLLGHYPQGGDTPMAFFWFDKDCLTLHRSHTHHQTSLSSPLYLTL